MNIKIISHRISLSWPLWLVLIYMAFGSAIYTLLPSPESLGVIAILLSPGATDEVSRIMLSFFTFWVLFIIHLETKSDDNIVDQFLRRNLPAILWGFGLACFFGGLSITLSLLYGLSGTLLSKDPRYDV